MSINPAYPLDRRPGVIYTESLLVVVIMSFLTVALLQWTFIITSHQAVNAAATEGARVASRRGFAGSTQQEATEAAVREILSANGMDAAEATVTIVDSTDTASVSVQIAFPAATVPNWLGAFGLSMTSYQFQSSALGYK